MINETRELSHAYIIESADVLVRDEKACELARSLVCENGLSAPCGHCRQCKMALEGIHPDIIRVERLIDDKGKQKRELLVEQIRHIAADAWVRPQQAEKKVYLISEAGLMNDAAQNAALKILEEPPAHAAFILCVDSAQKLLATIRSRCVIMRPFGEKARIENEQAREYISIAARGDLTALCAFCADCESLDNEGVSDMLCGIKLYLSDILCHRAPDQEMDKASALRLIALCDRALEYLRMNVGVKHILGLLSVLTI